MTFAEKKTPHSTQFFSDLLEESVNMPEAATQRLTKSLNVRRTCSRAQKGIPSLCVSSL